MPTDPTAPQPLDADDRDDLLLREVAIRIDGMRWTGDFEALESDPELVTALAERVRELRAEVDRLTADLAAATSQRDAADAPPIDHVSYFCGWSDAKAGRQYGEGRTSRPTWIGTPIAGIDLDSARAAQPQEGT